MTPIPMRISAVGRYVPARIVTAAELDRLMDLPDGWVLRKTGVSERHWADGETPIEMAVAASEEAFERSGWSPEDIDLIIYAATTLEQLIPDTAPLLQRALGLGSSGIKSFTVHSTCLSFMTALDIAASHIAAGRHDRVMIVGAEIPSMALNFSEPESAALLGDMATAVLLTGSDAGSSRLRALEFQTHGDGADLCRIEGGGPYKTFGRSQPLNPEDHVFQMDGRAVFKYASQVFPPVFDSALQLAGITSDDLDLFIPHQASLRGIRLIHRACGVPDEKVIINLHRFGNCVACSLPGAIYDAVEEGKISEGDTVLLAGTGAGLSAAAAVLTW